MPDARVVRPRLRTVVSALLAFAAAWLPGVRVESQGSGTGSVSAWLTTVDRANLLAPQAELSFQADSGSDPLTIDVDPATAYQVMDGFGASFTDSSAWLVHTHLTADQRHELFMRLFDRTEGIGLSYLRQPIGASDFALSHYSYDDMPPGQTDFGLAHFSIDHDRAYILPALREALAINPQLRIMASPWSAPGWMKTSGSMITGFLNEEAEAVFADYFVRFILAYQDAGVPIHRITPQNEPYFEPTDYPGMPMWYRQQARLVGTHLGPALAAAGLETLIDVWDHNWVYPTYAENIFADPIASPYAAGSAWHCYSGEPEAMTALHDQYPDKDVVVTECSGGYWTGDFSDSFASDMHGLIIAAPRNWARTVIKWNIALDSDNGPHTGGCTNCTGLVTIDQDSGTVASFNYDYYSLGHASKFVLPGARRIASNTFGSGSIEDVAFQNPDGSRVLIVFNGDTGASRTFKVREGGRAFSYTLPPRGAVTFTWTDTGTPPPPPPPPEPSPNLALNRPALASSTESPSYPAASAVDGNARTRWSSAFSDPQWLRVDLGSRYQLTQIVLNWEAAFSAAYDLQVSDDGTTWATVYSTGAGRGGTDTITLGTTAATGRYLRLFCRQRTSVYGQQWGHSLWEIQAFGSPAVAAPPPAPPNLALNRPALASSIESASYPAASAVDGNARTRWSSAFSDPQWLRVDLGSRYQLTQVVLNWETAFAVGYDVQVSDDGTTWATVYSTGAGRGGTESIALGTTAAAGRYLRVFCRQRTFVYGQQWGHSLWEIQAFGSPAVAAPALAPPNLALNHPALASSTESPSYPAVSAVDGNARTRWSSAFSDPQWLQVDLGSRYQLTQVVLNWEAAFAAAYDLQVSDDATTWATVYSTSAGRGGTETITLGTTAATGRYLRLFCRQRTYVYGQRWGHSLWEIQAYGTPAAQ